MNQIALSKIRTDAGTQSRVCITDDVVARYAERMLIGDAFPPVVLFHDGSDYFLADGFHRVMAASRNETKIIGAEVHKGTKDDALWYALGANKANGMPPSSGDVRRSIIIALERFADKSQTIIASQIGCSQRYVSTIQSELRTTSKLPERTVGKDGKSRPATRPKSKPAVQPDSEPVLPQQETKEQRWEQGASTMNLPAEKSPEDDESKGLWQLKWSWRQANKKEKAEFLKWVQESGETPTNTK